MDDVQALAQAQEILHVLKVAVTATAVKVHRIGRAPDRGEDHVIPTEPQILGPIAGRNRETGWDSRQPFSHQTFVKVDHVSIDPRACAAEGVDGARIQHPNSLFRQKPKRGAVDRLDVIVTDHPDGLIASRHLSEGALRDCIGDAGGATLAHYMLLWLGLSRRGGRSGSPRSRT